MKSDLPKTIIVPSTVDDQTIVGGATYRINGRVPSLTYRAANGFTLWRSSQPLINFLNPKRNKRDELYLSKLGQSLSIFNHDAPSTMEAYEDPGYYKGTKIHFYDLADEERLGKSYKRICKYANNYHKPAYYKRFTAKVLKSEWLLHVGNALQAASKIQEMALQGHESVLVYCKNGQLGSPAISSLAQIMIDPYYRTIKGFHILFLKEWIYFGHNFPRYLDLCNNRPEDFCPVLILFLDCLNQLLTQNEASFEYNHAFILDLANKIFKCRYFELTQSVQRYKLGSQRPSNDQVLVSVFETMTGTQFTNPFY